jgi:RNA polymerase sigma-70 factor (ECF subfamily)
MDGSPEKAPPGPATRNQSTEWGAQSTRNLLDRAQTGDERALEEILARYLPRLMRWATGRLPPTARDIVDTGDVVQESLIKVVRTLHGIRDRNPGTFPAYLRKAVLNRLRDEIRRAARRPNQTDLDGTELDPLPTPLEESIGRELANRYEAALLRLSDSERAVLFLKIEMGMNYREMADALDKPSADAARMAVNRAGLRLAEEMHHARQA